MDINKIFFNLNDYELTNHKLGSGSFGSVYVVISVIDNKKYAAKMNNLK